MRASVLPLLSRWFAGPSIVAAKRPIASVAFLMQTSPDF